MIWFAWSNIYCYCFKTKMIACRLCVKKEGFMQHDHSVKSVGIRTFSGPYFPTFGLNTGISDFWLHHTPILFKTLPQYYYKFFYLLPFYDKKLFLPLLPIHLSRIFFSVTTCHIKTRPYLGNLYLMKENEEKH